MYKVFSAFLGPSKLGVSGWSVANVSTTARLSSAWMSAARSDADGTLSKKGDVEKLFTDVEVQELLTRLTGMDLEDKVFRPRRTSIQQRSHYALMTDERLQKTRERMTEEAHLFLQFVPLKEPRTAEVEILAKDSDIAGFDSSKFVFTDITFDATDQDRTVVVREVDGTLRTATPEEHDRMNRVYYEKPNRPVSEPALFSDPWLQNALDRDEHEFVLDWACWYFEPDDPAFVKLSKTVFDRIVDSGKFDVLHSTRHFGTFVFYLALNGNIPPLLNHFGGQGRINECANLVRLQKTLHPDWRVTVGSGDSDIKVVQDFIKQNARFKTQLSDLSAFLADGRLKSSSENAMDESSSHSAPRGSGSRATVTANNVTRTDGPLGELSEEYAVKVDKGDNIVKSKEEDGKPRDQHQKGRFNRKPRGGGGQGRPPKKE